MEEFCFGGEEGEGEEEEGRGKGFSSDDRDDFEVEVDGMGGGGDIVKHREITRGCGDVITEASEDPRFGGGEKKDAKAVECRRLPSAAWLKVSISECRLPL